MAENGGGASLPTASSSLSSRPTLTLPPRSSMESLFAGNFGVSPGPMTLVSSFFADDPDSECRSFSQLLAGAMASPAASQRPPHLPQPTSTEDGSREKQLVGGGDELMFKQNRPSGLEISQWPVFTVPPGLSPGSFLDSPGIFPGSQSPFGMSHQQALAQVTAQAQYVRMQAEHANSSSGAAAASTSQVQYSTSNKTSHQQMLPLTSNSTTAKESSEIYHSDQRVQPMPHTVDKPTDDGYNWRKYGQKQVKGSEYPRSYYKCSHLGCPVKKKVEHSIDGQVTEIIYRGLHDHPLPNKRTKDNGNQSGNLNCQANLGLSSKVQTANVKKLKDEVAASSVSKIDCDSNVASSEHLSGTSGSEEVADNKTIVEVKDEDEPDSKRRNLECRIAEPSSSHKTVAEPKIIVQTTSEVDLLDDGYRWRKYGQKVVKGNPYPRSYYKCTYTGCSVRKHVERAATDPRAVITAYEGKHNHDVPLGKSNVRNTANSNVSQLKAQSMEDKKHAPMDNSRDTGNYDQQPVALLQLKEHPT